MGQALYRKYRSKKLDEVIGQEHITTTLKNALKTGKISHAYLFTGPKGVGKTSVARIMAHEVNNFPYDDDKFNVDIIEIDAASNRRIDEIRDLRDKIHIAPAFGKYKVYIIDEVHMLTKEAFNALLKTLEEPPEHVIFILATTEAHKLPATIVSRTQRFSFKPIESSKVVEHLKTIAKLENLKISDEALELIANHGEGSFRDSISLLDQAAASGNEINQDLVEQLIGIAPTEAIDKLLEQLSSDSPKQLIGQLNALLERGFNASSIAKQLSERLRSQLINERLNMPSDLLSDLLRKLIEVPASSNPDRLLELYLLEAILKQAPQTGQPVKNKTEPETPSSAKPAIETEQKPDGQKPIEDIKPPSDSNFGLDAWPKILNTIKSQHNTLYSIMRMGEPSFDGEVLTLSFEFAFHQKRLNENKNRQIIDNILRQHSSQPIKIVSVVAPRHRETSDKKLPGQDIKTISNIFGGAEVLDS